MGRPPGVAPPRRHDLAALAGLLAVLAFLWGRGSGVWFWIDEAIAVGVSSHPLGAIPELLRQDGSPPLYYMLLHGWMGLFGSSEPQTHALSLLFALAVVPAALWAGWSLFDRRTGWICAALAALNPYLAYYANETRMYSLVALLSLLSVATFLHAFVFRRRLHLVGFAVALTLLLYTHNWGLLLAAGAAAALVPCFLLAPDRRRFAVDAVLALGAVGILYAPWLPTLAYQWAHEPNPWARRATLTAVRDDLAQVVGGPIVAAVLGLGAAAALGDLLRRPWSPPALAVVALLTMAAVVLAAGWASSVWAFRYLAAVAPLALLVLGAGLARGGQPALAALVVTAFLAAPIGVRTPAYQKSDARMLAQAVSPLLRPGDLVISGDYSQVPLLSYYLPPGLVYAGSMGRVPRHRVTDWRHGLRRVRESDPTVALPPLLDALPPGAHVLMACPELDLTPELVEFHHLVHRHCQTIERMLLDDPRLRSELTVEAQPGSRTTGFDGRLLTKLAA